LEFHSHFFQSHKLVIYNIK